MLPLHSFQARRSRRHSTRRSRRGFTLLETALATVIIGVGVLALVEAQQAFLRSNSWSTQAATATYLANEIRELTRKLPKHDPVNGLFTEVSGGNDVLRGWTPRAGDVDARDFAYVTAFDGVTFSAAGDAGWDDGDLPGPIDAFGDTIPEVDATGTVQTDQAGRILGLQGWSQQVIVAKVDPFNNAITFADNATMPANATTGFRGLSIDQFPLRVTVIVRFRGPFDTEDREMARVSWIVP
ncbi:MAG: prepilin-type N-terminal cleavage/methylation domain-containing protein [Phycisphaerales bacterium]|nr:prepilin-type N-terminal cleavage/methylation domain-containing protein [Phycisphaerales bacterium]